MKTVKWTHPYNFEDLEFEIEDFALELASRIKEHLSDLEPSDVMATNLNNEGGKLIMGVRVPKMSERIKDGHSDVVADSNRKIYRITIEVV